MRAVITIVARITHDEGRRASKKFVGYLRNTPFGAILIEHFGSPSFELGHGICLDILEPKNSDNLEHTSPGSNVGGSRLSVLGALPLARVYYYTSSLKV